MSITQTVVYLVSEVCDHGVWATFKDATSGQEHTLSVLCVAVAGHTGRHMAPDGFTWDDEEAE